MHRKICPRNPNPNRQVLAFHFLGALARISRNGAGQSSLPRRTTAQDGRRIKRAAYASIALAAGPRRAWSRAVLCSLRTRARIRALLSRMRVTAGKNNMVVRPKQREGGSQVNELRWLVPGGRTMDMCSLLDETGDYIQCLTTQIRLMERIADFLSK